MADKIDLAGAIIRSQHLRNMDVVNVLDFGADRTGANPSTVAFQKAFDACSDKSGALGYGRALYIPGGVYSIDGNISFAWRGPASVVDNDTRRLVLIGDGSGCTFINDTRTAPGNTPLITFDGGETDPHLRLYLFGMRVQRPAQNRLGWGLYFKNIAILAIDQVDSQWFDNGAVFHDVIQVKITHSQLGANNMGLIASKINWTCPNVFYLDHVMFGGNAKGAAQITDGANFKFDTCTFEATGGDRTTDNVISYTGAPEEGGLGLYIVNGYFENNNVLADVNIQSNSAAKANHIIEGNSFQRTSPVRYCRMHINVSANNSTGIHRVHLRGNKFKFAGGYAHNAGDASVVAQTIASEVIDEGNIYEPTQPPQYAATVARGYGNSIVAAAKVSAGASTGIVSGYNAATVTKSGTGVYVINFKKAITSGTTIPVATVEGVPGRCIISGYNTTSVTVTVQDSAGNASDSVAFNLIVVGINL